MTQHDLCTQYTPVHKHLPSCIRYSQSVNYMRFLINGCINDAKSLLDYHKIYLKSKNLVKF